MIRLSEKTPIFDYYFWCCTSYYFPNVSMAILAHYRFVHISYSLSYCHRRLSLWRSKLPEEIASEVATFQFAQTYSSSYCGAKVKTFWEGAVLRVLSRRPRGVSCPDNSVEGGNEKKFYVCTAVLYFTFYFVFVATKPPLRRELQRGSETTVGGLAAKPRHVTATEK